MLYCVPTTYYFETQWRVSPEFQMWSFFSYQTELKFVLAIIAVSKSLLILNLRFPSIVSQNQCVWMHVEFGKFVLMILAVSKSLILLNFTFLPPFPLTNAYESWWKLPTIFLILCTKKPCNVICMYTSIPYVHPCLALEPNLRPGLPQRASSSCSFANSSPPTPNALDFLNLTMWIKRYVKTGKEIGGRCAEGCSTLIPT